MATHVAARIALAALSLVALTTASFGQKILYSLDGDSPRDSFGVSVSGAGDVNADGFVDLIVGAPLDDKGGPDAGEVRIISGADGSILYTFNGSPPEEQLGAAVAHAGDVNGDGYGDVIVGIPLDDWAGWDAGSVKVYSGRNGSVLKTLLGDATGHYFGTTVSGAGDVDADGFPDLIVGTPVANNKGLARVFSGATGAVLYTFHGNYQTQEFGSAVSGAGDVDGDGHADLIVGARADDNQGKDAGLARVFSGKDGSVLWKVKGASAGHALGTSVGDAGDVDGDGWPDVIVGAPQAGPGLALVVSGIDGSTIFQFVGDGPWDQFGISVAGGEDINGDGVPDLVVGATEWSPLLGGTGYVRVLLGRCQPFHRGPSSGSGS